MEIKYFNEILAGQFGASVKMLENSGLFVSLPKALQDKL